MKYTWIYLTIFKDLTTGSDCVYVGSHTTTDPNWPSPGCKDPYVGSCGVVMNRRPSGRIGNTILYLKDGWKWVSTQLLCLCDGTESTLGIEGQWIESAMLLFGIHPKSKEVIRSRNPKHPLLDLEDGVCLNCHKNSDKFLNTEYYKEWLSSQGVRSALGNTKESREKALRTYYSHYDKIREMKSELGRKFAQTEKGKEFLSNLRAAANTPEARARQSASRYANMDQWICIQRNDILERPIRLLSQELGLGRGAQQCWSRLGKPDKFEFKGFIFKLVRRRKSSGVE